jgi:hypothetical protein
MLSGNSVFTDHVLCKIDSPAGMDTGAGRNKSPVPLLGSPAAMGAEAAACRRPRTMNSSSSPAVGVCRQQLHLSYKNHLLCQYYPACL